MSPYTAAAGPGLMPGWLDAIIDPLDTRIPPKRRDRLWISMGIEAASQASNEGVQYGGVADVIMHSLRE